MKRGIVTGFITTIFLGIILFSYSGGGLPDEFPAPDFALDDIFTGENIGLATFRERPVLLYFFASW